MYIYIYSKEEGGGGGEGLKSPPRHLLYECAASVQVESLWLKTTPSSARGEPQTLCEHIGICMFTLPFTHVHLWVRVHVHTHMHVLEWICVHTYTCPLHKYAYYTYMNTHTYGVVYVSRIDKIEGLFCKRAL